MGGNSLRRKPRAGRSSCKRSPVYSRQPEAPMLTPARILRRLRSLLTAPHLDDELDEEMRFHIDMATRQHVAAGMDEQSARELALREFGGSRHRDAARDARGIRPIEDFLQDLRVGLRSILKQRTHAVV